VISLFDKIIEFGLIFLIVFTPLAFGTVHIWSITIMELTVIFLVIVWIIKLLFTSYKLSNSRPLVLSFKLAKTPLNFPILIFICLILFQLLPLPPFAIKYLSPNTYSLYKMTLPDYDISNNCRPLTIYSHATKLELLKFLSYIFVFFIIVNNIKTRRQIEHLLIAIIIIGAIISLFGIIQRVAHEKIYWLAQLTKAGYTFGTYVNKDHFAGYMEMVTLLAIGLLMTRRSFDSDKIIRTSSWHGRFHKWAYKESQWAKTILIGFLIIIMVSALFLSLSRGGIISFLLSIIIFVDLLLLTKRSKRRTSRILIPLFSTSAIFLIWLGIDPIIARLSTLFTPYKAILPRANLWKDSLQIFRDFPIFGSGLGTYQFIFPKYKNVIKDGRFYMHAHNDYIEYLSDIGIVGSFLFFGMIIFFLIKCLKLWQKRRYPYVIGLGLGISAGVISILLHSIVDFNLHVPANALLFFIILALLNNILYLRYIQGKEICLIPDQTFNVSLKWSIFGTLLIGIFILLTFSLVPRQYMAKRYFEKIKINSPSAPANLILLKKAIRLDSSNSQYHYYLGKAYEGLALEQTSWQKRIKFLRRAMLEYQEAIDLEPTSAWYHLNLGWVYATLGLNQASYREVHLARILDPKNPHIAKYLANWDIKNVY